MSVQLADNIADVGGFYDILVAKDACQPALDYFANHRDAGRSLGPSLNLALEQALSRRGPRRQEIASWFMWGVKNLQDDLSRAALGRVIECTLEASPRKPGVAFRIRLVVPASEITAKMDADLLALYEGKLDHAEQRLASGDLVRAT